MRKLIFLFLGFCSISSTLAQITRRDAKGNLEVIGANGKLKEYHFLDTKGDYRSNSIAKIIFDYDSSDFLISETFLRANGRLYQYPTGVAARKYQWNQERNQLWIQNYDSLNERTVDKKSGASIVWYKYDSVHRVKEITYLNTDSLISENNEGHAKVTYQYPNGTVEKYYTSAGKLIRVVDDATRYLSGLQLQSSSIPKWLRKARQYNRVDGVSHKSLYYELSVYNQKCEGTIQFAVKLVNGEVYSIKALDSKDVPKDVIIRTLKGLKHTYFISLSGLPAHDVEGQINVNFARSGRPTK